MPTHFRDYHSIDTIAQACDSIAGGLETDPDVSDLAGGWRSIADRADALSASHRKASRAVRRARQAIAVLQARWDVVEAAFGRAVVDATGGARDRAPYTRFFADLPPGEVRQLGTAREVASARRWIAELGRDPAEALAKAWSGPLAASTDALDAAIGVRAAAIEAAARESTGVALFREDVNREIDRLEGELRKRFPGEPGRVRSYFEPLSTRHARSDSDEAQPAAAVAEG